MTNISLFLTWLQASLPIYSQPLSVFPDHNLIFHLACPPPLHLSPLLPQPPSHPLPPGSVSYLRRRSEVNNFLTSSLVSPNLKITAEMSSGGWHGEMKAAGKVFFSPLAPKWRRRQSVWVRAKKPRLVRQWEAQVKGHPLYKISLGQLSSRMVSPKKTSPPPPEISKEWQLLCQRSTGLSGPMT